MALWIWIAFIAFVLLMLALDLGLLNRRDHVILTREALGWTLFWVALALLFNVLVFFMYRGHWLGIGLHTGHDLGGHHAAIQYFTGYLIEKSLSLDNIFVIALIFSYFKVPAQYQHRVLFWGILGALIMRGAMIAAGAALITRFSWAVYVFGGFLIFTALRMLVGGDETPDLEHNRLVRWTRKLYPVSEKLDGHNFFTRLPDGRRAITPLLLVLLLVESSDVIFAVDSIPAIFAVTVDPLLSSPGRLPDPGPPRNRTWRFPPSGSSADVSRGSLVIVTSKCSRQFEGSGEGNPGADPRISPM